MKLSEDLRLPRAWDTASGALAVCARSLGDPRSPAEIAAASGLAFRVSVDAQVSLAGPHAWPWREELCAAAERLGYLAEIVASSERGALHAAAQARAVAFARAGLAAGRPTMIWGVHAPEFGVVRGSDGDELEVSGILDGVGPARLDARELGRGDVPVVFALQLVGCVPLAPVEAALATLRAALTHGRGPAPTLAGFSTGLAAFATALAALESGVIDPGGLAYSAQRWAESRAAICGWLDGARALGLELDGALAAFRRSASMLAELAGCHPFPPAPGSMLTNNARDQAHALVDEARRAEHEALDAVEHALAAERRASAAALPIVDADEARLGDLYACAAELPVPLAGESAECRERARPRLGGALRAKLIYDGARVVGQLLYAPLEAALYPVAADGRRWFLFCPWLARDARGRGLGARLFAALEADARAEHVDGLLTIATGDERFLHAAGLERHGFVEVDRRGDTRLLERALGDSPSRARLIDVTDPIEPARSGKLPLVIRQAYNCPLLLHTRRSLARAAANSDRVSLDERDATAAEPAGAAIAGRPLLHGYVPDAVLDAALTEQADRWSPR
ncbi:MAG TPA: GNAT family N-acetyltransferase [Polyangia bacterium]|nr:GNAT family N-acetyltransferase [Polyangia bacterium]